MQSLGLKLEFLRKCVIFCVCTTPLVVFAQQPSLPLPAHPERLMESPEHTAPRESQPGRETRKMDSIPSRGPNVRRPIPGQPGRNLPPVGGEGTEPEGEAGTEDAAAEESLEAEDPGSIDAYHTVGEMEPGRWSTYIPVSHSPRPMAGFPTIQPQTTAATPISSVLLIPKGMNWWEGGRIFVYGQNVFGKTLSARYVGDTQLFSNIDSTISDEMRDRILLP